MPTTRKRYQLEAERATRPAERRAALEAMGEFYRGIPANYLEELRRDWPE